MFAALGAKISCVDDITYSSTGEPFSTVLLPETESNRVKELQADDTSLTYEFARKVQIDKSMTKPQDMQFRRRLIQHNN